MARIIETNIPFYQYLCEEKNCDKKVFCSHNGKDSSWYCCEPEQGELNIKYCYLHKQDNCKHKFKIKEKIVSENYNDIFGNIFKYDKVIYKKFKQCSLCEKIIDSIDKKIKTDKIREFFKKQLDKVKKEMN